jgi:hypothetical protein
MSVNANAQPPPAQAVESERSTGKPKRNILVREAVGADLADIVSWSSDRPGRCTSTLPHTSTSTDTVSSSLSSQILIFWSSFSIIFPFHLTEPLTGRPTDPIRLHRTVHRQKAVLANPGHLTLVAEDRESKEILGWAGYVRPEACRKPHPWIVEDDALAAGTDEDREAWEGVERQYFNGESGRVGRAMTLCDAGYSSGVLLDGCDGIEQACGKVGMNTGGQSFRTSITGKPRLSQLPSQPYSTPSMWTRSDLRNLLSSYLPTHLPHPCPPRPSP